MTKILKFGVVAVFYNILAYTLYIILVRVGLLYLVSSAVSYIFGILLAYILNSKFVFEMELSVKKATKFSIVYLSNLILSTMLLAYFVEILGCNPIYAQLGIICFNALYNYTLSHFWTFRSTNIIKNESNG